MAKKGSQLHRITSAAEFLVSLWIFRCIIPTHATYQRHFLGREEDEIVVVLYLLRTLSST